VIAVYEPLIVALVTARLPAIHAVRALLSISGTDKMR
jgi:hypothetical protein